MDMPVVIGIKQMKPAGARQKGQRFEREFASMLRRKGIEASRMPLSGSMSHFKSDIFAAIPWSMELKHQEKLSVWSWWDKAVADAGMKEPLLVFRSNHRPAMAMMRAEAWADLVAENIQLSERIIRLEDRLNGK